MTWLEPFDGVAPLPMPRVSAHLKNMSSFSAIKLDVWTHKTGHSQGLEAITEGAASRRMLGSFSEKLT